jgi:hypothetical protein
MEGGRACLQGLQASSCIRGWHAQQHVEAPWAQQCSVHCLRAVGRRQHLWSNTQLHMYVVHPARETGEAVLPPPRQVDTCNNNDNTPITGSSGSMPPQLHAQKGAVNWLEWGIGQHGVHN